MGFPVNDLRCLRVYAGQLHSCLLVDYTHMYVDVLWLQVKIPEIDIPENEEMTDDSLSVEKTAEEKRAEKQRKKQGECQADIISLIDITDK